MASGTRWTGLEKFKARIAVLPARVKAKMQEALEANADDLVSGMQAVVRVEDGELKASIRKWSDQKVPRLWSSGSNPTPACISRAE